MAEEGGFNDSPLQSIAFILTGVFVFSLQDVLVKWISDRYPVHEIIFIRSVSALLPMLLLVRLEGGRQRIRTRRPVLHSLRALLMFLSYISFYLSLAALPLAEAVTLFFASPLFITILSAPMLGDRVSFSTWLPVLLGFSGVALMLQPGLQVVNPAAFLPLISALLYAVVSIITRQLGKADSGICLAFYPTVLYILFATLLSLGAGGRLGGGDAHPSLAFLLRSWQMPSHTDLLLMMSTGLIAAGGFYCLSQAYRLSRPSFVAPFEYTAVPISCFWGYLLWQEVLNPLSVSGILLIIGSGLYLFAPRRLFANKYLLGLFKTKVRK